MGIIQHRGLIHVHLLPLGAGPKPAVFDDLVEEGRARIGRGDVKEGDIQGQLLAVGNGFLDGFFGLAGQADDEIAPVLDARFPGPGQRPHRLLLAIPLADALQNLLVRAFDAPGNKPAARPAHELQHLPIHEIHPAIAGPFDIKARVQDPLRDAHDVIPVHREQVRVHVNVAHAQVHQDLQFLDDILGRAHPHRILIADMLDAELASRRAAAAGDDEGERALHHGHPLLVQGQEMVQGDR